MGFQCYFMFEWNGIIHRIEFQMTENFFLIATNMINDKFDQIKTAKNPCVAIWRMNVNK